MWIYSFYENSFYVKWYFVNVEFKESYEIKDKLIFTSLTNGKNN